MIVGIPDGTMVNDKWEKEIKPIFDSSSELRKLLPTDGPGSRGGKIRDSVRLTNGVWLRFMTRGGSDQSKAGYTARVVIVTEAAGWSVGTETSTEADPLEQIRARQQSWDWDDRLLIVEGTVTVAEAYPWALRANSSESRLVSPCPHCGRYISPEREHLLGWQDAESAGEAAAAAYFECPECAERIDDDDRRWSVERVRIVHGDQRIDRIGRVRGKLPKSRRLWFRWSGWHNLFNSIGSLAVDEWRCARTEEDSPERESAERRQAQFKWCTPYEPKPIEGAPLDRAVIVRRMAADLPRGVCPEWTQYFTIGVDMGMYAGHMFGVCAGDEGPHHCPTYDSFDVDGDKRDVDDAIYQALLNLHEMIEAGWAWQGHGDELLRPQMVFIDAGYKPDGVFRFIKKIQGRKRSGRYLAVVGRGSAQMQKIYTAPKKRGGGVAELGAGWHVALSKSRRVWEGFIDSDFWKDRVHHLFRTPDDSGDRMTLFTGTQNEHRRLARHLTNEERQVVFEPGKGEVRKFVRRGQQHYLDAAAYAEAALDRLRG